MFAHADELKNHSPTQKMGPSKVRHLLATVIPKEEPRDSSDPYDLPNSAKDIASSKNDSSSLVPSTSSEITFLPLPQQSQLIPVCVAGRRTLPSTSITVVTHNSAQIPARTIRIVPRKQVLTPVVEPNSSPRSTLLPVRVVPVVAPKPVHVPVPVVLPPPIHTTSTEAPRDHELNVMAPRSWARAIKACQEDRSSQTYIGRQNLSISMYLERMEEKVKALEEQLSTKMVELQAVRREKELYLSRLGELDVMLQKKSKPPRKRKASTRQSANEASSTTSIDCFLEERDNMQPLATNTTQQQVTQPDTRASSSLPAGLSFAEDEVSRNILHMLSLLEAEEQEEGLEQDPEPGGDEEFYSAVLSNADSDSDSDKERELEAEDVDKEDTLWLPPTSHKKRKI